MKIAHISDLHLNTFYKNSHLKNIKYLLKYILNQKPDHIVITGDLTDNADHKDFEILRTIFKSLDILNSDRLSVVIGNHDVFGGPQTPEDIFNFPEKCRCIDYEKSVKEFKDFFEETFANTTTANKNMIFPFLKKLNNIQIIGLNSVAEYSRVKNPFASNGKIKKTILLETELLLEKHFTQDSFRLALIHHHFNKINLKKNNLASGFWQKIEKQTMKLKKKKRIISFFKENKIDLVLHGHLHINMEYNRKGITFFNAGATIKGNIPNSIHLNFIGIDNNSITTETHKLIGNSSIIIHRNVKRRNDEVKVENEKLKFAANY